MSYLGSADRIVAEAAQRMDAAQQKQIKTIWPAIMVGGSMTVLFLVSWMLNAYALPALDDIHPSLRDVAQIFRGVTLAAIAIAAEFHVVVSGSKLLPALAIGMPGLACVVGLACLAVSGTDNPSALMMVWAVANAIGSGCAYVAVGVASMALAPRTLAVVLPTAYALSYAMQPIFRLHVAAVPLFAVSIGYLAAVVLVLGNLRGVLPLAPGADSTNKRERIAIDDAMLAQPLSFPSFLNHLFVCLFVFSMMRGLALTFNAVNGVPLASTMAAVPMLLLAVFALSLRGEQARLNPDGLLGAAFLVSLAGLAFVPAASVVTPGLVNVLLTTGGLFFQVVGWYVLAIIGQRNPLGAVRAFAWGNAAMSVGVVVGAAIGRALSDGAVTALPSSFLAGATIVIFAVYYHFFRECYSLAASIEEVQSVEPVQAAHARDYPDAAAIETVLSPDPSDRASDADRYLACIQRLGEDAKLTRREIEILALLGRGRNGHYIADTLVVSYNTVKTHVARIYAKLGVHSQQELIDLVESTVADEAS